MINKKWNYIFYIIVTFIMSLILFSGFYTRNKYFISAEYKPEKINQIQKDFNYLNKELMIQKEVQESTLFPKIDLYYNNKCVSVKRKESLSKSYKQKSIMKGDYINRNKAMTFAYNNGFSKEESIKYAYPEIFEVINNIANQEDKKPTNASIIVGENTGKIEIVKSEKGCEIDKNAFYNDIFDKLVLNCEKLDINLKFKELEPGVKEEQLKTSAKLRGSYNTDFSSSSESRKNNIRKALRSFNGVVLHPGEVLSFNKTTGLRNEVNGYQKAKIIKNGTFYHEYGGGVCQVSTTLYNSALLADLEIIEVNPHSLPINYEKPCFDAMVNSGSSDLVIKNNTNSDIIIATCSERDSCLVNIYGEHNPYEIVRKSEKTEEFEEFSKEITTDYVGYGFTEPLSKGERRVISYGKPGYRAVGKLEYYKDGFLVKTKNIRSNIYRPTKEVVLIGE